MRITSSIPRLAACRIDALLLECEDVSATAADEVLFRIFRRTFRGEAGGERINGEIGMPTGRRVVLGDFGITFAGAAYAFQLSRISVPGGHCRSCPVSSACR